MTRSSRSRCRSTSASVIAVCWLAPLLAALLVSGGLAAASPQAPGGNADAHPSLPPGDGRELMIRVCSQCHEPEMAADQQMDEAGWKSTVDQMAGKGANATEAEFQQIVQYLTQAFPSSK